MFCNVPLQPYGDQDLLAEIFLSCCTWLAELERDNLKHMLCLLLVITLTTYSTFRAYLHITNVEVMFIYIYIYIYIYIDIDIDIDII